MFEALRRHDDPGLTARLLRASNAIDAPVPAHPRAWPRGLAEAAALLLISAVIFCLLVALP
jgi:hypothetical protein